MSGPKTPAIEVSDLSVVAGGRPLLSSAQFCVNRGELVLLVGASGTGKTLTLALLAGLWRNTPSLSAEGKVSVLGSDALATAGRAGIPGVGIVFQDFALLDDVDAEGNVQFGLDHRLSRVTDSPATADTARQLLEEFGLPGSLRPAQMSGGMKQRLALARAMAFGPELLFYDEPTSGLDPAMSQDVARRIREAHDRRHMTSVVVSHDLASLAPIADRIVLLDPREKALREIPAHRLDETMAALRGFRASEPTDPKQHRSWASAFGAGTARFLDSVGGFVVGAAETVRHLWPRFPVPRWGWRFFWNALRLGCLGSAIPFLGIAGLIAGFITTFFMFGLLPLQDYTEPVLVEEFIGSLGYALFRVVAPVVITLLFASRAGAAFAADVGNRVLTRQVDALRSHGVPPSRYLLTGMALSSLLGLPFLFLLAYGASRLAAAAVFLGTHPGHGSFAFQQEFHRLLGETWGVFPGGSGWVLGKLLLSALGTAGISYFVGIRPKDSGSAVADGVTATIIRTTMFVLMVQLIFAFFEF